MTYFPRESRQARRWKERHGAEPAPAIVTLDESRSPQGIKGRLSSLTVSPGQSRYAMALDLLQARGCGCWVGRTVCGDSETHVAVGGVGLGFMCHRAALPGGVAGIAVLCHRHALDPLRDIPVGLLRSIRDEYRSYLRHLDSARREAAARLMVTLPLSENTLTEIERIMEAL